MDNGPKKFRLPQDNDESLNGIPCLGPRYFKPGSICGEVAATKEFGSVSSETQLSTSEMQTFKQNTALIIKSTAGGPTSKFQSEFGNLKESKYYDKSLESSGNVKSRSFSPLVVNSRQRGNPLLKHIKSVPWEFSEIVPDYIVGKSACALFLSLRYHNLFPNYIHDRLKSLGKSYSLRVLLVQVDVAEPNPPLKDLSVISILADCTLMVSWSAEEAGTYLETYKMFENKSADLIKEKQDSDNYSQLIDCLTTIRSINKTDAVVLLTAFKNLKGIMQATIEQLTQCPGMGPLKVR